ncbi:hypothetical protein [Polycladomyces subterraneus]|uniref:Uncharacterized protein n=1 Tax=Polycladomyces subterraneus TaxID=1016997 RepID=A0ABT8INW3_9BACL|nr:hypothetical protein [Polycladomyces subterraneus]MDN4593819.1 hypothetical protein [Polycladomyces subterraneus]
MYVRKDHFGLARDIMGKLIALSNIARKKVNREITSKIRRRRIEDRVRQKIVKTSGVDLVAILLGDEKEKRKYEMLMAQHRGENDDFGDLE